MNTLFRFLSLLALLIPQAKLPLRGIGAVAVVSAVPALVSLHSGSNSGTNSVGTKVNNTCATNAYCVSLPAASLAGNMILVAVRYSNASAQIPTITDDKSNTYTRCSSEAAQGNDRADIFYVLNAVTGTRVITVTYPAAVTRTSAFVSQWNNVNAFDVCGASSGTATTTFSSGSVTPTVTGDMFFEYACTTTTLNNVGAFTAGSQANITWVLESADRRDGCATQFGVYSSTSAINPQMTIGSSNGYVAVGIAFKAATQGTAPSGMYIRAEEHISTASGVTGPFTEQFPSAGNLLISANQCGGTTPMSVSSISDGTNTWRATAPVIWDGVGGHPLGNTLYAENATSSSTLSLTITTAGTGDCSFWLYDIVGADAHPFLAHLDECTTGLANPCQNGATPITGATVGLFPNTGTFNPGSLSGLVIATGGLNINTATSVTAPSGAIFDADTTGGETLSGPWPVDENNFLVNFFNTDNAAETWTMGVTSSTDNVNDLASQVDSFLASGATKRPANALATNCVSSASATTLACSFTPHVLNNTVAILISTNQTSGNITLADGAAGNTIVKCSATSCSGATDACVVIGSTGCMKAFYVASINGTAQITFTLTTSVTTTYRSIWIHELTGVTTQDQLNIRTTTSSGAPGTYDSGNVTTTGANEILLGWNVSGGTSTFGSGNTLGKTDFLGQVSEWRVVTSTAAYNMNFIENTGPNGTEEGAGIITFK